MRSRRLRGPAGVSPQGYRSWRPLCEEERQLNTRSWDIPWTLSLILFLTKDSYIFKFPFNLDDSYIQFSFSVFISWSYFIHLFIFILRVICYFTEFFQSVCSDLIDLIFIFNSICHVRTAVSGSWIIFGCTFFQVLEGHRLHIIISLEMDWSKNVKLTS